MSKPQYLTGDKPAIKAFLDRFDVSIEGIGTGEPPQADKLMQVFLFDCDGSHLSHSSVPSQSPGCTSGELEDELITG